MNQLPKVIEDIIYMYKHQLDFMESLDMIKTMEHEIDTFVYPSSEVVKPDGTEVKYFEGGEYECGDEYGVEEGYVSLEIFSETNGWWVIRDNKPVFVSKVW